MRLTNYIRRSICTAMVKKRFDEEGQRLDKEMTSVGVACYEHHYSEAERKLMDSLPEGWLQKSWFLHVSFHGYAAQMKLDALRRFPSSVKDLRLDASHELSKRWGKIRDAQTAHSEKRSTAYRSAMTVLKSCSTVNTLTKRWPEAVPFIPQGLLAAAPSTALAIPIPSLNAMLGLP